MKKDILELGGAIVGAWLTFLLPGLVLVVLFHPDDWCADRRTRNVEILYPARPIGCPIGKWLREPISAEAK